MSSFRYPNVLTRSNVPFSIRIITLFPFSRSVFRLSWLRYHRLILSPLRYPLLSSGYNSARSFARCPQLLLYAYLVMCACSLDVNGCPDAISLFYIDRSSSTCLITTGAVVHRQFDTITELAMNKVDNVWRSYTLP